MNKFQRTACCCAATLLAIVLAAALAPAVHAETYKIDPTHSSIVFRIKHLDITYVYGRFNDPSGTLVWNEKEDTGHAVDMTVKAENVDTNNEKRDKHLRSEDFFHIIKYPYITFKSSSFTPLSDGLYEVKGDLTLHGVTRPLTVTARHTGAGEDPWGGFRTGFETTFPVRRSEFGMDTMLGSVGDEVELTISIEAIRQ